MVRAIFLFLAGLMATVVHPCQQTTQSGDPRVQAVERRLAPFDPEAKSGGVPSQKTFTLAERMAEYKIPGVSIALVDDDRIAWARAYGTRKAGQDAPVAADTLFEAASTTKMITAVVVMHFVEEDRIDLDRDVNAYLKSWKVPDGALTRGHKVTVRLLLTHRSGLNGPKGGFSWDDGQVPTLIQVLKGAPPARNQPAAVEAVPGTEWRYSNFGYVVIQLLLEDLTGKPFPQVASEVVFKPLGMDSSTLAYPPGPELGAREALPHDAEGKACEPVMHPTAVAQGGLVTTPSDLARFTGELMLAYRGRSHRILSQSAARAMFQKELDLDPGLLGFPMGEGLGVFVRGSGRTASFLHPGDNYPGASCWLVGFPELGKGAVIMTNGAKGNLLAMEILAALGKQYGWPDA